MSASFELPPEIAGPSAWYGPEMAARTDWIHALGAAEIDELDRGVRHLAGTDVNPAAMTRDDFPLPTLGPRLRRILSEEVLDGRGFVLLRGLPVRDWGPEKSALA